MLCVCTIRKLRIPETRQTFSKIYQFNRMTTGTSYSRTNWQSGHNCGSSLVLFLCNNSDILFSTDSPSLLNVIDLLEVCFDIQMFNTDGWNLEKNINCHSTWSDSLITVRSFTDTISQRGLQHSWLIHMVTYKTRFGSGLVSCTRDNLFTTKLQSKNRGYILATQIDLSDLLIQTTWLPPLKCRPDIITPKQARVAWQKK